LDGGFKIVEALAYVYGLDDSMLEQGADP